MDIIGCELEPPALLLHGKSDTLWTLPNFAPSSIKEDPAAKIIRSCDPDGLPTPEGADSGRITGRVSPVKLPSAHCLTEAYILLIQRTPENFDTLLPMLYWHFKMVDMFKFVAPTGRLNDQHMDKRCRDYFRSACVDGKAFGEIVQALKVEES